MQLKLYDTLTRQKRDFVPLDWEQRVPARKRRVRMYVCGPTVYDFAHIGNARPVIVFDVLFRVLRHLYGASRVIYVRNVTDVDDKINARAAELGISIRKLTQQTYKDFAADTKSLGCLPPTFEPRATNYIDRMRKLIERLIKHGNAYVAKNHVLFDVRSMPEYGQLSKRTLDEMMAGARVEVAPFKRHPMDFVLWKPSKPGEPAWPSPGGIKKRGRPGWHIECSAMAWKHLGEMFDIHGGGIDLVFPHHENEIAQSRAAFHTPLMARFWVHNGFLQLQGEKMAKSEGNVLTIRELLHEWTGGELRLAMLMSHYREPVDWSRSKLEEAASELGSWAAHIYSDAGFSFREHLASRRRANPHPSVIEALNDDLNTPDAITALRDLFKKRDSQSYAALVESCQFMGIFDVHTIGAYYNRGISSRIGPVATFEKYELAQSLRRAVANNQPQFISSHKKEMRDDGVISEIHKDGHIVLRYRVSKRPIHEDWIELQIKRREMARKAKDFAEADRIRELLAERGITLKDNVDGKTTWEIRS
jgi:cysteinyl-tRNA synthetase